MRVVIGADGHPAQVKPTGCRPLNTVPTGQPPPILSAIRCKPRGVRFDPAFSPTPNREVEQRNVFNRAYCPAKSASCEQRSNRASSCRATLTVKNNFDSLTP